MADILSLTGGLQSTTSSFLRSPEQLLLSINVHGDQVGSLTKRLGYSQYGNTVSASNSITGLATYPDISGGTENLIAFSNGTIYYDNAGTWTSIHGGLTANANIEFRVFLDQVFVVGANSSGTYITTANIDATTYSTVTNVTSAPKGKYVEIFKDRVYIANLESYASRFAYSSIPNSAGTTITWNPTDDYEEVMTNNGEQIMGLHTNKSLNQLLIFKRSTVHAWDTFRLRDVGNVGTSSHRSIVTINYTTFFFNEKGIYAYTGSEPQLISRGIEKWIQAVSDPSVVFATQEDNKYYKLFVGDLTVDGESYSNCEIRYSLPDNTWTIYSYAEVFTCYALHRVSGKTRPYAGTSLGKVHQLAIAGDAIYADDATAISAQFMFETDLGMPSERKSVDCVLVYSTRAQNLTGRIRARGEDWSSYFYVNNDEEEINVNPRDGRFLQFHFSESSTVQPFVFEGISLRPHLVTQKYE